MNASIRALVSVVVVMCRKQKNMFRTVEGVAAFSQCIHECASIAASLSQVDDVRIL